MLNNFCFSKVIDHPFLPANSATTLLDADGEYVAQLITCLEAKIIRYVHFRITAVTTAGNYEASLRAIDDSALPSFPGAVLGGITPASEKANIAATGWKRWQLDNDYTTTKGLQFFFSIKRDDAVSGNIRIGGLNVLPISDFNNYYLSYLGGAYVSDGGQVVSCAFESTDGTFMKCIAGAMYSTALTVNTGTTPDEVGNVITLPYKHNVIGIRTYLDLDGACDLVLYSTGTSTLSLVANRRPSTARGPLTAYFTAAIEIQANTSYRTIIKPTTATSITAYESEYPTGYETTCKALITQGATISKTYRTDAGAWTDDTSKIVNVQPLIDKVDFLKNNYKGSNVK